MAQAGLARGGALTYSRLLQLIVAYCGLLRLIVVIAAGLRIYDFSDDVICVIS